MNNIRKVLVVCTGNICRSPIAEGLLNNHFNALFGQLLVDSVGTHALEGHPPAQEAQQVMQEIGVDISKQKAKQCTSEDIASSDLILVMQDVHRRWIYDRNPTARGKVFLIGKASDNQEVADPYGMEISYYYSVRDQLDEYCELWCDWVRRLNQ